MLLDIYLNMDKIFYSMYISEVVNNFGVEDDPCSKEVYDILYKALDMISNAVDNVQILIAVIRFQLKMMQISGFAIELDTCLCCGEHIENQKLHFEPMIISKSIRGTIYTAKIEKKIFLPI